MHKTRIQWTIYGTTELPFLITRIESNIGGPESKSNRRPQNRFFDASGRIVAPLTPSLGCQWPYSTVDFRCDCWIRCYFFIRLGTQHFLDKALSNIKNQR